MQFAYSDKVAALQDKLKDFMDRHIYPNEAQHAREIETGDRWQPTALMEALKKKARLEGLWNLFLPDSDLHIVAEHFLRIMPRPGMPGPAL